MDYSANPRDAASAAKLCWCSDDEPGILRMPGKKGFRYRESGGNVVRDAGTLDRIKSLVIPPAWTDVWIAPGEDCHLQATGRDQRGRKQYRYHDRWTRLRYESKFATLPAFCDALSGLRKAVDRDLRQRNLTRQKVLATIVWLLDNTMIRIGNAAYARENGNFGLTTLRNRHADIRGSTLRLSFRGKSGKEWALKITDRRIVTSVRKAQELPGQTLFQYLDENDQRHAVRSQDVNDYIRQNCKGEFTSKHFRTWGGTVRAAALFNATELPDSRTGQKRMQNVVIDQVARHLGNTRAVCRACYIHPYVLEAWEQGKLPQQLKRARARLRRTPPGLDRAEAIVKAWLEIRDGIR
jgi:DNA topoisomerase-1